MASKGRCVKHARQCPRQCSPVPDLVEFGHSIKALPPAGENPAEREGHLSRADCKDGLLVFEAATWLVKETMPFTCGDSEVPSSCSVAQKGQARDMHSSGPWRKRMNELPLSHKPPHTGVTHESVPVSFLCCSRGLKMQQATLPQCKQHRRSKYTSRMTLLQQTNCTN